MVTAKFHIVGEKSLWYKVRVQEEILAQGLEGSVMDTGENSLVLVVDGKSNKIKDLYDNLNKSIPDGLSLTEIVFKQTKTPSEPLESSEVLELLRQIERNTRRINQKLDMLLRKRVEPEEPETEEYSEEESADEVAESSFAAMFRSD